MVAGHMSASTCPRCGVEIRWVTVEGEGKIPLDAIAVYNGRYRLDPNDVNLAEPVERPGLMGFMNHDDTCGEL